MKADAELLREYARGGSEGAFAELVERHLPLVYAAALRQTRGDAELARDICQTVFFDLARKARSLAGHELLAGWLFTATRFQAATALRGIRRRQQRERMAASMQEEIALVENPDRNPQLLSALDGAMEELPVEDRNAVLLRFFQGKAFKEVGTAFGISEDAARMRVGRALGKLQSLLERRGAAISATALGTFLAAEAGTAAPAGLALSISTTATAGAALVTTAAAGVALTTTQKALLAGALAVVAGLGVFQTTVALQLRRENEALRSQQQTLLASEQVAQPQVESSPVEARADAEKPSAELLRLRGEVARLRRTAGDAVAKADRVESAFGRIISNTPPIKTYTATTIETAAWNEGFITGGWKMPSGKRTFVMAMFDPMSPAGNVDMSGQARQVSVSVKILECSDATGETLGLARFNVDGDTTMTPHKVSRDQLEAMLKNGEQQDMTLLSAPKVLTMSGRQAEMRMVDVMPTASGEQYSVGPTIDIVPTISADGKSVQVAMVAKVNCRLQSLLPDLPDMSGGDDESDATESAPDSRRAN